MKFFISIIAFLTVFSFSEVDPNFHIYLAYGQSNMMGSAAIQTEDKVEHPRFKMFATTYCPNLYRSRIGVIYPAVPPMFQCNAGLSLADWFGRHLADSLPNVTIGIVPVAVSGASIKLFQESEYVDYLSYVLNVDSRLVELAKNYDENGNVMKRLLEVAKKAQEVGVIKGILFHQGEADIYLPDWESRVAETYNTIIQELNLNPDEVPFLAGEMLAGGACDSMRVRVRQLPNFIKNAYVVSSENLTGQSDRLHFDNAGYKVMGLRYAQVMLKLLSRKPEEEKFSEPFYGSPIKIPGKVETENYDISGVGIGNESYFDTDSVNRGNSDYRNDEVDLYEEGTGVVLGSTKAGEFLKWTLYFEKSGYYIIRTSAASKGSTSSFQLFLDYKPLTLIKNVLQTAKNGRNEYEFLIDTTEYISSGEHSLNLYITSDSVNIDFFEFVFLDSLSYANPIRSLKPTYKNPIVKEETYFDLSGKKVSKENLKRDGLYIVKVRGQKAFLKRILK